MEPSERRQLISQYNHLTTNYIDHLERSHRTFDNMESHIFQLINSEGNNNNNNNNIRSDPQLSNRPLRVRDPFASPINTTTPNDIYNRHRNRFVPSQNLLDTLTLWALFPNGINTTQTMESLTPVIVRPTRGQIQEACEEMTFGEVQEPGNRSCPITQEEFNNDDNIMLIRQCGHIFNRDELNRWFQQNVRCPMCRYDIREYRRGGGGVFSRQNSFRPNYAFQGLTGVEPPQSNEESHENEEVEDTPSNSTNQNRYESLPPGLWTNDSSNNFLGLINENLSRVIQSSDISDNINVNFEFSTLGPFPLRSDISNNFLN
jgi:hypothetical protein